MKFDSLEAVSPLEGRYCEKAGSLAKYFSEFALMKHRVQVESAYFIALSEAGAIRKINKRESDLLRSLYELFQIKDARHIKQIEKKTNHDVKSVEYFIKEKLGKSSLKDIKEFVHFALTSEDVNNIAYSLMIKECLEQEYGETLQKLIDKLICMARDYRSVAMLSRTHGQPASPTILGKELAVFVYRLKAQMNTFPRLTAKLNGAVGNYNAHHIAFPEIDWIQFSKNFIKSLGLMPTLLTTQIEGHDCWAQLFHAMIRINNILIDLNRDLWTYISLGYFGQEVLEQEVGSSTMPHKINPIKFENSEGNLGVANSLLNHLASKLPVSRLQRDLSDSTVCRNIGIACGYAILAFRSLIGGLDGLEVNRSVIEQDLNGHPEVLAEAMQTILRKNGTKMPYESLKQLTRGQEISLSDLHLFIDRLDVPLNLKNQLKQLKPEKYTGLAHKLIGAK